jgi:TolB-like protein/DNA-binding winged helix-turn-helix (wHTH) protein/Tfp pilus assembly protein PilF
MALQLSPKVVNFSPTDGGPAMRVSAPSRQIRFGPFEVDLHTGELRKQGLRLTLKGQPFDVLAILLARPGEMVTREELQKKLWPADTFVDFEHGLNTAVNKLREALGDSAENPRFVETLARRGYRFIYPVEGSAASQGAPSPLGKMLALQMPARKRWFLALTAALMVALVSLLFALNVAGVRDRLLRHTVPRIESIAVLPLENLSGDPEQEYFAEGMTDELIATLGKVSALRVISRTSAMRYKKTDKLLPQIARELNVDAVVEGSVLRAGDRVRITAQLVQATTDKHLWAETYEREMRDVLSLQEEIAKAIAQQVQAKLSPQEQTRLAVARPVNPEAHRLYLLGRFHWNKRTEEGFKNAIDHFQSALEIDPGYAAAYAGLADSYNMLSDWGFLPPKEAIPRGKAAAQKALEIDESLAEAHTSLALAYFEYDWDWAACEKEYKRAIELDPNYATTHQWYAEYLWAMKRHAEAIAEDQRAQQLDPLSPIISTDVASDYLFTRQYDEAIRRYRNALSLFPEFVPAHLWLGHTYMANGMHQQAIVAYQKAMSLSGASAAEVAALGQAYAKGGIRGYYLWELRRLREESKHRYVRAVDFAYLFAGLGEKDQAFSYLEKAYEDRDYKLGLLQVEPRFDPLRSDPRFQDLLRRMNFPP